jgi:hypothetical protein
MSREQWNELYRRYPGDVVKHLTATDDLLCLWAAEVIENLRRDKAKEVKEDARET